MKKIGIIGECMVELSGEAFGQMSQGFGGDSLNTAIYLSRMAALNSNSQPIKTHYVTALGSDRLSMGMIDQWQNENVDTSLVLNNKNKSPGLYMIELDADGERSFHYWRSEAAARFLLQHPDFERVKASLAGCDMILLSGISLAILPDQDRHKLLLLLNKLRSNGVEIAFDNNFRPALWPDRDIMLADYQRMLEITDLALLTFDDEQAIWGERTTEETLVRLRRLGVKKAVLKLGEKGCLYSALQSDTDPTIVAARRVENVVDTTAAGDSFNGGFLSSYLTGGSLQEACERGNATAGLVIQHQGAIIPKEAMAALSE